MSDQAKSEAQAFSENFTIAQDSPAKQDSPAETVASYLDARNQYGSVRTLKTPDGRYAHAHYAYHPRSLQSHSPHFRSYRSQSLNWARPVVSATPNGHYAKGGNETRRGKSFAAWFLGLLGLS